MNGSYKLFFAGRMKCEKRTRLGSDENVWIRMRIVGDGSLFRDLGQIICFPKALFPSLQNRAVYPYDIKGWLLLSSNKVMCVEAHGQGESQVQP